MYTCSCGALTVKIPISECGSTRYIALRRRQRETLLSATQKKEETHPDEGPLRV